MEKTNNKKIKFNERDFDILKCSQPDGFGYIDDDRALKLMDLGYLKFNAKENWSRDGYKATKKGTTLFLKWTRETRESHGHEWETYEDHQREDGWHNEGDTYSQKEKTEPYSFAYSEGFHNGFKCKKCEFEFCHHCKNESNLPKCSEDSEGITMSDDSKLDSSMVALDKSLRSSLK